MEHLTDFHEVLSRLFTLPKEGADREVRDYAKRLEELLKERGNELGRYTEQQKKELAMLALNCKDRFLGNMRVVKLMDRSLEKVGWEER